MANIERGWKSGSIGGVRWMLFDDGGTMSKSDVANLLSELSTVAPDNRSTVTEDHPPRTQSGSEVQPIMEEPLIDSDEAGVFLGYSPLTICRMAKKGLLPAFAFPVGSTGKSRYRFKKSQLEAHVKKLFREGVASETEDTEQVSQGERNEQCNKTVALGRDRVKGDSESEPVPQTKTSDGPGSIPMVKKSGRPVEPNRSPVIIRKKKVLALIGLSASTVYQLQKAGKFPEPVKLGQRATGWLASDIERWVAAKAAERAS